MLSTFFGLLSLLAYVRYVEAPSWKRYALVAVALALGLMAKPMLVTWPFVLLLLDYWPLHRFQWHPGNWDRGVLQSTGTARSRETAAILSRRSFDGDNFDRAVSGRSSPDICPSASFATSV